MAISKTYRLITLVLATAVLMSSFGFAMDMHYCQNELKSISLFGTAESCHDQKVPASTTMACHEPAEQDAPPCEDDCCSQQTLQIADHDTPEIVVPSVLLPSVPFFVAFVQAFVLGTFRTVDTVIPHHIDPPPGLNKDLLVMIQSFLL